MPLLFCWVPPVCAHRARSRNEKATNKTPEEELVVVAVDVALVEKQFWDKKIGWMWKQKFILRCCLLRLWLQEK